MHRLSATFGFILFSLACSGGLRAAQPPNVLFIVVDDLNLSLGCYGNTQVRSPHIDRLAARGARFDRAYAQYPLCNPSRVSFLTGRRPETTGVYVLNTPPHTAVPDAVTLPRFFRQQGYATAGAGKIFHNVRTGDAGAWDHYQDGEGEDAGEQAAIKSRYGGGDGRPRWFELEGDGSKTRDGLNAATIRQLVANNAATNKPFFLAAGFHKPHLPWTAPKRFFDLYREGDLTPPAEPALRNVPPIALQTELSGFEQPDSRAGALRGYYACVSFIDSLIGQLLDELDRGDLWKNTVVVLLGDHGFHLGDHGGLWAKLSAFDQSTRVPLIMAGAGIPAGRVVTTPVELVDVYPTLADLAGLTPPERLEGRSLRPLLQNGREDPGRIARSLVYHYDVAGKRDVAGQTVIGAQWRYTEWDEGRAGRELYSRNTDAGEYHNRAADPAMEKTVKTAAALLRTIPAPKPGPANRPRALAPAGSAK
ncbi:sulfatase [Horticoccus sp. 23ND18S-11]|uniref:sulfatase n=1 Tax=Horticoccus sp. 23ND18S-11 TaxID=3391832 RepID=UPI0039C9C794